MMKWLENLLISGRSGLKYFWTGREVKHRARTQDVSNRVSFHTDLLRVLRTARPGRCVCVYGPGPTRGVVEVYSGAGGLMKGITAHNSTTSIQVMA